MEKINLNDYLASNEYPGRGIAVAMAPDGRQMFIGYFIMGRSENSRNRVFDPVPERGGICTIAADPAKLEDPSLDLARPARSIAFVMIATLAFALVPVQDATTKEWSLGVLQNPGQYCAVLAFGLGGLAVYHCICRRWQQRRVFARRLLAGVLAFSCLFGIVHIGIGKFGQWNTDSDLVEQYINALALASDLPSHLQDSPHLQDSALPSASASALHLRASPFLSSSSSLGRAKKSNFSGGSPSATAQMRYTVPMYSSFNARSSSSDAPAAERRRSSAANSRSLELRYCLKSSELREFSDSG